MPNSALNEARGKFQGKKRPFFPEFPRKAIVGILWNASHQSSLLPVLAS
jgi:hypothetical protein